MSTDVFLAGGEGKTKKSCKSGVSGICEKQCLPAVADLVSSPFSQST
jgi:hypothetical protein